MSGAGGDNQQVSMDELAGLIKEALQCGSLSEELHIYAKRGQGIDYIRQVLFEACHTCAKHPKPPCYLLLLTNINIIRMSPIIFSFFISVSAAIAVKVKTVALSNQSLLSESIGTRV